MSGRALGTLSFRSTQSQDECPTLRYWRTEQQRRGLALGKDHDSGALASTSQPESRERLIAPTTALGSLRGGGEGQI